jgi:DNA-binding NtrC family response regulator
MLGESGSGKDHLARYIHDHSKRAGGLYFSINCAAVAPELAESELFGHERGAFTGARSRKRGLLELAEGGTLLLNEIGELSLHQQAKLLTFLETKKFTRVGGEREVDVNARLMAATNRDLEDAVKDGSFRKDLFYRLNVLPITVPPLRERRSDIPMLVQEFVHDLCEEMQLTEQPIITPSTMKAFQAYQWPGNVRELRNVLERALILSGGARVDIASLGSEPEIYSPGKELDQTTAHGPLLSVPDSLPLIARPHGDMGRRPIDPGRDVLRTLKQQYVIDGKWSIEQLAKAMHLHRSTLSKWFKKHGLIEPTRLPQEKAKV